MNLPSKQEVDNILREIKDICHQNNITLGWLDHSFFVADAASIIAKQIGLDENKAFIFALFHDVGRAFSKSKGTSHNHGLDGYRFFIKCGFPEIARYCITHEFPDKNDIHNYPDCVFHDMQEDDKVWMGNFILSCEYDDYDKLVQLADTLATRQGYTTLEQRFLDLMRRKKHYEYLFHSFTSYYSLKKYFDARVGKSVYDIVPKFWDYAKQFDYEGEL